ncbi:5-oxoprolinase/urea amidolyase family protein [Microbacterium pseudoresistens]|uniref:KipI family sensor histidine kinase inhibitor n=1 Tax=Microbacterium pseudoresistens TaxID=640634 RepID=A0A7Y9EU45_9MICO|nr:urea amidolyase family protein [Microbacterium pseudoresistens]NYD53821.1 KipI family sensor histidine kinase inhibitor [Microbacterium pseudoresistens]
MASDRGILAEFADLATAVRAHRGWAAAGIEGVRELIPAARTVLVRFDPALVSRAELERRLGDAVDGDDAAAEGPEVRIPVHYDGDDLAEAADLLGVSAEELVRRHLAAEWRVAFSGFAPGFGYAVSNDPLFAVPRRATPRTGVPAGAVGLAGEFTGVYPRESPGGWQLIGRTDAVMWDPDRDPPALLVPGTRIRFERAPARGSAVRRSSSVRTGPAGRPGGGEATEAVGAFTVIRPPLQLLIQDRGRPGYASLGVSVSGAADRTALRDANRAVGNAPGAAVLEAIGAGMLRYRGPASVIAFTGAEGEAWRIRPDGDEQEMVAGIPYALGDGDAIEWEAPERGLRRVIGVRGGILAPTVLGSAASDTLADLGPAPVRADDAIAVGDPAAAPHPVQPDPLPRMLPASGEVVELEVVLGPRDDWFTPEACRALAEREWEVTPRSDRVGLRLHGSGLHGSGLHGPARLERAVEGELPSEGMVTGALQVPPDGQPVLFLADHPVTGGYPVIGCVADGDLDLAAQLPPGARIRFRIAPAPSARHPVA